MGKSRLVHEFLHPDKINFLKEKEFLESRFPQVFLAQTDAILRTALNPFRYWLRRYFGILEIESAAHNLRSFNDRLDDLSEAYLRQTGIADTVYFGSEAEFFVFDKISYHADIDSAWYKKFRCNCHGQMMADCTNTR